MKTKHPVKPGDKFGRWTAIANPVKVGRIYRVACRCNCGTVRDVIPADLCCKRSTNCGCLRREKVGARNKKHGKTYTREYVVWCGMLARCRNPNHKGYDRYGGRGISVCQRWQNSFKAFMDDMGMPPTPRHTIDRKDNDGDYEPGNCRWATNAENCANTRSNHKITFRGETLCITHWAKRIGISTEALRERLLRGWSVELAFQLPALPVGQKIFPRKSKKITGAGSPTAS